MKINTWKFFKKLVKTFNRGKDFQRALKYFEKEILLFRIVLKKKHFRSLISIINNFKKNGFQKKKLENLKITFFCQKQITLQNFNFLKFSLEYHNACKNRLSQFLRFSGLIFRKKKKEFFSGFFSESKKKVLKTFVIKKISEPKEKELIWRLIRIHQL